MLSPSFLEIPMFFRPADPQNWEKWPSKSLLFENVAGPTFGWKVGRFQNHAKKWRKSDCFLAQKGSKIVSKKGPTPYPESATKFWSETSIVAAPTVTINSYVNFVPINFSRSKNPKGEKKDNREERPHVSAGPFGSKDTTLKKSYLLIHTLYSIYYTLLATSS